MTPSRRGPLIAEVAALVVLVVLDTVLFARSGTASGSLAVIAVEFAPALGPVVAVLAVLRRRFPENVGALAAAVAGLSVLGTLVTAGIAALGQSLPPQPSGTETLAIALVAGAACHRLPPRQATALAAFCGLAAVGAPILRYGTDSPDALFSAAAAVVWGAALAVGLVLRDAGTRTREETLRVRTAERLRLARELHDLVAHQITGIVVRVQAAQRVAERSGGDTATFTEIEAASADALASMRRLVGTLRTDGEDLFSPPAGLVAAIDRAVPDDGSVELTIPDGLGALAVAPEVVTTVHRLLVEALTNARRHAPRASKVAVTVRHDPDDGLVVEVVNDGTTRPARPGGYGLIGMTERVTAVGGTVRTGPESGRRWRVVARLPLAPA